MRGRSSGSKASVTGLRRLWPAPRAGAWRSCWMGTAATSAAMVSLLRGGVLADAHRLDVEALVLEGAEQLLDRPAAAVQVGDREGLGCMGDRERGEEPPVHALAGRRIDLVDEGEDDALRQAGPHPDRWPREFD